jgi:hypothetical protein
LDNLKQAGYYNLKIDGNWNIVIVFGNSESNIIQLVVNMTASSITPRIRKFWNNTWVEWTAS